jgi:hypothetical protein
MLGERDAVVIEVHPFDVHGVGYVDVTLAFRDRSTTTARLGRESVPDGLAAGDQVIVSTAVNMVVAIHHADGREG